MKYLLIGSIVLLTACSGEEGTEVDVNSDGVSSVVETTNPTTADDKYKDVANNKENPDQKKLEITSIKYEVEKHNFGNVFYPSENLYTFKFTNTGDHPLVIEDARASCGCTVPNKPEEPIMPGEVGELDVIFRPKEGQVGSPVTKRITVTANTNPSETYLEISAMVLEAM